MAMKLGLVRQVDHMGRISIPTDFRSLSRIYPGSTVEIHLEEDGTLSVQPHKATCALCGEIVHEENYGGSIDDIRVCAQCKQTINQEG